MSDKVKSIIQGSLLLAVLAFAALSALPDQGHAAGSPPPDYIAEFCPTGGANCGADSTTGTLYQKRAAVSGGDDEEAIQ